MSLLNQHVPSTSLLFPKAFQPYQKNICVAYKDICEDSILWKLPTWTPGIWNWEIPIMNFCGDWNPLHIPTVPLVWQRSTSIKICEDPELLNARKSHHAGWAIRTTELRGRMMTMLKRTSNQDFHHQTKPALSALHPHLLKQSPKFKCTEYETKHVNGWYYKKPSIYASELDPALAVTLDWWWKAS